MKYNFYIFIISTIITTFSFGLSLVLKLNNIDNDYLLNVLIGVFGSGLLTSISSLTTYIKEKNNYHVQVLKDIHRVLGLINSIIIDSNCVQLGYNTDYFEKIKQIELSIEEIKMYYYFHNYNRFSKRDKLIREEIIYLEGKKITDFIKEVKALEKDNNNNNKKIEEFAINAITTITEENNEHLNKIEDFFSKISIVKLKEKK